MKFQVMVLSILLLLSITAVSSESNLGDTVRSGNGTAGEESEDSSEEEGYVRPAPSSQPKGKAVMTFTRNFYVALGLGAFAVLIVLYIIFIFVRGPKEKWGPGMKRGSELAASGGKKKKIVLFKKKIPVKEVGVGEPQSQIRPF